MRRFFFYLFIALLALWTGATFYGLLSSVPSSVELDAMSEGTKAGTGAGVVIVLLIWAVIAVPLGIFALIAKPR